METPTDASAPLSQRLSRGFLAVVMLVVLYALSIGPAQGFFYARFVTLILLPDGSALQRTDGPLSHFYAPVTHAAIATGLWPALRIYCNWWGGIANRYYGK